MKHSKTLSKEGLEEFGRRVRAHMQRAGIRSGGELAQRASKVGGRRIYRQLTHKWINGIAYAGPENREVLARVFHIPLSELEINETAGGTLVQTPLSENRVHFRYTPDPNNPALVRAEMSDVLTVEQAERIAAILAPRPPKSG